MKQPPALTPDDWRAAISRRDYGYFAETEDVSDHGKAALYLYEKSVGFSREDASRLAEMIRLSGESESNLKDYLHDAAVWEWMESLRARIEALLPPETP